ncbi:MAG: hypothetical protein ACRBK7_23965 [Acidimicrobiales bacterium]
MMKRAKQTVAAAGRADGSNDAGGGDSPYNMSMDHVPAGWVEAQSASPISGFDSDPLDRAARFSAVPTGQESTFIPNIAALGASFVGGISWFLAESQGIYNGPWLAVVVGAFIALAIRATAIGQPPYRAILALSAYLLTLLLVLVAVTHRDLTAVYGSGYTLQEYEETLIRTRFQDLGHLLAYGLGAVVASVTAYTGRSRR